MNEDNLNNSLIKLLNLFKNRPHHLAKFLIENSALSDNFIKKIIDNKNLDEASKLENMHFSNISNMMDYYNSLIDIKSNDKKNKTQLSNDLNNKLTTLISEEKYEEAANLRDYMILKGIKRKKIN